MNAKTKTHRSRHQKQLLWDLCLYIADRTPRSLLAFENLNEFCETHLAGHYHLEVVDVLAQPQVARADNIVAVPTLVCRKPDPARRVIGNLSDHVHILSALRLTAQQQGKVDHV